MEYRKHIKYQEAGRNKHSKYKHYLNSTLGVQSLALTTEVVLIFSVYSFVFKRRQNNFSCLYAFDYDVLPFDLFHPCCLFFGNNDISDDVSPFLSYDQ